MITELTPEQEALIPIYREKWKAIALSTARIDRQKAAKAVEAAYKAVGEQAPEIYFFNSPFAALNTIENQLWERLKSQLETKQWRTILENLTSLIEDQLLTCDFAYHLWPPLWKHLFDYLFNQTSNLTGLIQGTCYTEKYLFGECIDISLWACYGSFFDFSVSVMECTLTFELWLAFESLTSEFFWIYPFRGVCLVCDRPTKLAFDAEGRLHAEGEPAIQFADGFSVYAHHGELINCQKPAIQNPD